MGDAAVTLVTALALLVGALVAMPFVAHRLRRRRAEDIEFAAVRLLPKAIPQARRRSKLEDRALFALRVLAVCALALLGASPLIRCSRLALDRQAGASVALALVVDDSMSMRAGVSGKDASRFELAKKGALDLLGAAQGGDVFAVIGAGSPARVLVPATSDTAAVRAALESLEPSDRATDLTGAIAMADGLLAGLPQVDRRIVLFSDLADGEPDAAALGSKVKASLWAPLDAIVSKGHDCAVMEAVRVSRTVRVEVRCGPKAPTKGRRVALLRGSDRIAEAPLERAEDGAIELRFTGAADAELSVVLTGGDALASDDRATVIERSGPTEIAIVADRARSMGGAGTGRLAVDEAFHALASRLTVRPLPVAPDNAKELSRYAGVVLDDPAGLTPEQRRALGTYLNDGGVLLLGLGPRSASAPLGATLEPVLDEPVRWTECPSTGASYERLGDPLQGLSATFVDLGAKRRIQIAPKDRARLKQGLDWTDGAPLIAFRPMGAGMAWVTTVPFSVEASDFPLRPAFVELLSAWLRAVDAHGLKATTDVGRGWRLRKGRYRSAEGPQGAVEIQRGPDHDHLDAPLAGPYTLTREDGQTETRYARPVPGELDLRPRKFEPSARFAGPSEPEAMVDVSWVVALILLGLTTAELVWRWRTERGEPSRQGPEHAAS